MRPGTITVGCCTPLPNRVAPSGLPPPPAPRPGSGGMSDLKLRYRSELRAARRRIPPDVAAAATRSIANTLIDLPVFQLATDVLLYSATEHEVGTEALRTAAEREGKRIYYPRTRDLAAPRLEFARVGPGEKLAAGKWGIGEPLGAEVFEVGEPALVVVPGVAFDRTGARLGRGGGCYDRVLRDLRPPARAVGIAFALQVVPGFPQDAWDERVDVVVTEAEIIWCAAQPPSVPHLAASK